MSDIDARPDGCVFRTLTATFSGAAVGGITGAVTATWSVRFEFRGAAPRPPRAARRHAPHRGPCAGRVRLKRAR